MTEAGDSKRQSGNINQLVDEERQKKLKKVAACKDEK